MNEQVDQARPRPGLSTPIEDLESLRALFLSGRHEAFRERAARVPPERFARDGRAISLALIYRALQLKTSADDMAAEEEGLLLKIRFASGQEWSYDLAELGQHYSNDWRLMQHWRDLCPEAFIEVEYERLVADTEGETRRVLDYLNLPWHADCLNFHALQRPVHTASMAQVRQPIYTSSMGKWEPFLPQLAPLIAALDPEIRQAYAIPNPEGATE